MESLRCPGTNLDEVPSPRTRIELARRRSVKQAWLAVRCLSPRRGKVSARPDAARIPRRSATLRPLRSISLAEQPGQMAQRTGLVMPRGAKPRLTETGTLAPQQQ